MPTIHFEAELFTVGPWTILRLPESASAQLPSRGQTMVQGTINDLPLRTPLEPDGKGSHWFRVGKTMLKAAEVAAGDMVALSIEPVKEWMEPVVPPDLENALQQPHKHTVSGAILRPWRAGNGSGGYVQPTRPKHARDG